MQTIKWTLSFQLVYFIFITFNETNYILKQNKNKRNNTLMKFKINLKNRNYTVKILTNIGTLSEKGKNWVCLTELSRFLAEN